MDKNLQFIRRGKTGCLFASILTKNPEKIGWKRILNPTTLEIPKDVLDAQKFIQECGRDMGFMGSPEYDRQKKIVEDEFGMKFEIKEKEDLEIAEYLKLKSKCEGS